MLTMAQFDRTRRLALRLAGIELVERHRELLDRRSRRLGVLDGAGLDLLLSGAEAEDPAARRQFVGLVTTNFTGFFRHPQHFDLAAKHALGAAHCRGQARLWSAAAATGEEPYSLAMALREVFGCDDPPASILATDIDVEALEVAQRGEYAEAALRALTPQQRTLHLAGSTVDECGGPREARGHLPEGCNRNSRGEQATPLEGRRGGTPPRSNVLPARHRQSPPAADHVEPPRGLSVRDRDAMDPRRTIAPAVRRRVEFQALNLVGETWPVAGPFDVIFCRNVLMYLEARHRQAVLERLAALLAPDGLLLLDPTEHLGRARHLFLPGADGVYALRRPCGHAETRRSTTRKMEP
jgi:chemotaxis methyl-accepting protein methylase